MASYFYYLASHLSMSKEKDILISIAHAISEKSNRKFKSNVEFADICNLSESSIRRIIQGDQNMSIKVLSKICEALNIKMSDLLKEINL
jgi:DNA-binding Xre family transcriptional regulator